MNFKNKKVLVTAGPTWVPIDKVRVISNIATGQTGILLAQELSKMGAKVTLLLGPAQTCCLSKKIKLLRFQFFDQLKVLLKSELAKKKYAVVIHSAAVSDYRSQRPFAGKVKSGLKSWQIRLVPSEKLIRLIKKIDPGVFLIGFKFKPQAVKNELVKRARILLSDSRADLVVSNSVADNKYRAYIIGHDKIDGPLFSKKDMVSKLIGTI
jgi:phosphopantothenoylcysteine decarboxylase/phosphopantothenate--cysteine ligase